MKSSTPILEINLKIICDNYKQLQKFCGSTKVSAVVKADAYGLGVKDIAQALHKIGCRDFFVVSCLEGVALRNILGNDGNINIYIMHGLFEDNANSFINFNLIPVINNLQQYNIWQQLAAKNLKKLSAILHVNTGMHRYGMPKNEIQEMINSKKFQDIDLLYIMSHLACSDDKDNSYNNYQLNNFKEILVYFPGIKACFANSDGIFLGKEYHFDMVRPGAALYGLNYNSDDKSGGINLKNPIRLSAPIIQLQTLAAGSSIGYNMSFVAKDPILIATIAVGYADGYLRHFSKFAVLFIEGHEVKIVGRISMDFITLDVTDIPKNKVFLGQYVEIIGPNITPRKLGKLVGTIGYEILTLLGKNRYLKNYITENK